MGCCMKWLASLKPMVDVRYSSASSNVLAMISPLLTMVRPVEQLQEWQTQPKSSDTVKMGAWVNYITC